MGSSGETRCCNIRTRHTDGGNDDAGSLSTIEKSGSLCMWILMPGRKNIVCSRKELSFVRELLEAVAAIGFYCSSCAWLVSLFSFPLLKNMLLSP